MIDETSAHGSGAAKEKRPSSANLWPDLGEETTHKYPLVFDLYALDHWGDGMSGQFK